MNTATVSLATVTERIELARRGVKRSFIDELAAKLGISTGELARQLPVSQRTLLRYRADQLLDRDLSDHAIQIHRVYTRACEVFGSEENAARWVLTPIRALGFNRPFDYLDTFSGIEEVLAILGRIEHGVFS